MHIITSAIRIILLVVCTGCFSSILAQETPKQRPEPAAAQDGAAEKKSPPQSDVLYRIGTGDLLDISVTKHEELSRSGVRVDNNGYIQLPRIEKDVQAACRTEKELAEEVKKGLWFLKNPDVQVSVKEFNSTPVSVIGAVNAPSRFQLQRQVRLLELIAMVNGPSQNAGKSIHIIHAPGQGDCVSEAGGQGVQEVADASGFTAYDLEETLRASPSANPVIRPGDIIRIPNAPDPERAYIIGNVKSPQAVDLKERITLSQAIAMANGVAPDSNIEKIKITRSVAGSDQKSVLLVNLKLVQKNQSEDVALQPNDVVEVPGGGAGGMKGFLQGFVKTMAPGFGALPLRVIRY